MTNYIYKLSKILSVFSYLMLCSYVFSQNDYNVVAVGAAGLAKENLLITYEQCSHNASMNKNLQLLAEITRNDFSFYQHLLKNIFVFY